MSKPAMSKPAMAIDKQKARREAKKEETDHEHDAKMVVG